MPENNAALDVESPTTDQDVTDTSSVSDDALIGDSHTPGFSEGFDVDDIRSGKLTQVEPEPEATDKEEGGGDKTHESTVSYDRFKEVIDKAGDLTKSVEALQKQNEHLSTQHQQTLNQVRQLQDELRLRGQSQAQVQKSPLDGMTQDDFISGMEKDGLGFIRNIIKEEAKGLLQESKQSMSETLMRDKAEQLFNEYSKSNSDFVPMLQDGRIEKFKNDNPQISGNVITFHKILSLQNELETLKTGQEQAIKDGVKAEIEKLSKERKAREESDVRPPGGRPGPTKTPSDKELQETDKHGGLHNVLLNRLRSRRGKAA